MAFAIYISLILSVPAISASAEQDIVSSFEAPRCSVESATEGLVANGNVKIEQNRLAAIFPEWGPIFRVAFEMKIDSATKIPYGWYGVLDVTNRTLSEGPGSRIPGTWLYYPVNGNELCGHNSTCLMISSYISSQWEKEVYLKISRDRFVSIEIAQWVMDGVYFYHVYMDGKHYSPLLNRRHVSTIRQDSIFA